MFYEMKNIIRFNVLAVLALEFILPVSSVEDHLLDGFISYDEMSAYCLKNAVDDLDKYDEENLQKHIAEVAEEYNEQTEKFFPVFLQELKCVRWFLTDRAPTKYLMSMLYMKYLSLYLALTISTQCYAYEQTVLKGNATEVQDRTVKDSLLLYAILIIYGKQIPHDEIIGLLLANQLRMIREKSTDRLESDVQAENGNIKARFEQLSQTNEKIEDDDGIKSYGEMLDDINKYIYRVFPGCFVPQFAPFSTMQFLYQDKIQHIRNENLLKHDFRVSDGSRIGRLIQATLMYKKDPDFNVGASSSGTFVDLGTFTVAAPAEK